MSNKAYYFGDAKAIARLMKKMYFGVETEVPIYEEHEVTTTKQLSVANLGDFFEVTTNTPTKDPWTFADTGTAEVRMAGVKKDSTQYDLTLKAKRALTGVAVDAEYYFSGMYGNIYIYIANTSALSKDYANEDKAKTNYWTGTLAAGDTIEIRVNYMVSSTSATPLVSVYVTCDGISTTTIEQVQVGTANKELARRVIRAYQPDANGKAQLWFDADAVSISVTFTGEHTVQDVTVDGAARKLYTLTGDGVLTVSGTVSFFMIGGGSSGERGKVSVKIGNYYYYYSGRGGPGGHVASGSLSAGTWQITIGSGGESTLNSSSNSSNDGGDTTIVGSTDTYTAAGATITSGGTGGGGAWRKADSKSKTAESISGGKGDGVSTIPFGLVALLGKPGGGGGGGGLNSHRAVCSGGDGGTNGGDGKTGTSTGGVHQGGNGGADGGGNGGDAESSKTINGHPGTTPGAGGAGGATWSNTPGEGGAGADGAVWLLV